MSWVSHSLGGISLLFTDPATSTYLVEDVGEPPEEEVNDEFILLNDGAGARVSAFAVGKAPLRLHIICAGDTQPDADTARDALQTKIDAAYNGDDIEYEYQEDPASASVSWKVIGGKVRPRWHDSGGAQIFSIAGRYTSLALLQLFLSKG